MGISLDQPQPNLQIPGLESVLQAEADLIKIQGDKAFLHNRPYKPPTQQQFQQPQFQQPQFQQQQFQQPPQFVEEPKVPGLEAHKAQEQALLSTQILFKANQPDHQKNLQQV